MTVTNGSYDWNNINTAAVSGMAFSGEGEYITVGVLKDGKYLHLFVNGVHALSYESAMTGSAVAGVFGFNTNMTLTEYFTDTTAETLAAKKAMLPRYVQDMGDASVMQYDAATDTITVDMDSSNTRSRAQLYENGLLVEGKHFAVIGHIFPFYMNFKGGKGLASFGGLVLAHSPCVFLFLLITGTLLMFIVNYSYILPFYSSAAFTVFVALKDRSVIAVTIAAVVSLIIFIKHFGNYKKAKAGSDNKIRESAKKLLGSR